MKQRLFSQVGPLTLAGLALFGMSLHGQDSKVVGIDFENHGSVPPATEWYACARKLDGRPTFDVAQGNKCLREILSHHGYFKSGRIKIAPSKFKSEVVIFVLESPALKLTNIDYGIREELQSEFRDYVARNGQFPRIGDDYDSLDEENNASRIRTFFESKGIMVGVSRQVILNYRNRTASLTYRVWEGPDGPASPLLDDDCDAMITYLNLVDLDDFTPVNLILKATHTRDGECLSESSIRADEQTLKSMKIFSDVNYEEGNGNDDIGRGVSIHVRTKPLAVSEVSIEGFGLTSTGTIQEQSSKLPDLLLNRSQDYRRSDAEASRKRLEAYFKTDTACAQVFEDDEIRPDGTLKVTYQVLTWPPDELYMDGQRLE